MNILQIPEIIHKDLKATVNNFIYQNNWFVPAAISTRFPALVAQVHQMIIPIVQCEDKIVWSISNSGLLTIKEANSFLNPIHLSTAWGKLI